MSKEKVLAEFVEAVTESLVFWAKNASRLGLAVSASSEVFPIDFVRVVKHINAKLNFFREELKINYEFYQDLEKQHGLKPLSLAYLESYSVLTQDLSKALDSVNEIAGKYRTILQAANTYHIDVEKYISQHNQNALDMIFKLTLEKLLDMLNSNRLRSR